MIDEKLLLEAIRKRSCAFGDEILDWVEYLIESQPKVAEWIPCSERLPQRQDSENTILKMYITQSRHEIVRIGFVDENGIWRNEHGNRMFVIAWQPLPQPYKGE